MSEIVAQTIVSTDHLQAVLSPAEHLSGPLRLRKEQAIVLLSYCREFVDQISKQASGLKGSELPSTRGMDYAKSASDAVRGVFDVLTQKGFLWCVVNTEKLENQVRITQEKVLEVYQAFQINEEKFQSDLAIAQKKDKEDLAQHLFYLSQDDDRLLEAIQDRGGVYRRTEELEVNIIRHVENIPVNEDPTPEDRFLQAADEMLRRRSDRKSDLKFPNYILSSLSVDHHLHRPIGNGASGQVYLGEWQGTCVGIKRMHPSEAKTITTDMRKKINHEVSLWADLRHDNILPLYGACPDADVPFLVMKYCPDGDVRDFLRKNPTADRFRISCDVAVGLAFLHSKSIVHADIKGMNVLISGEHRALLTDFGLSIVMNEIRNLSTYSNEMQNKPRGTMAWMAPEVHSGSRPDKASDVYSLAMTIWEIYSGQTPFSETLLNVLSGLVTSGSRPERPSGLSDDKVWAVVRQCWSHNAESRPTADQVVNFLNSSSTGGISISHIIEVDESLLASHSSIANSWNWNSSVTANNSFGTQTSKRQPWQIEESPNDTDGSNSSTTADPKDELWMDIFQSLPPQWEHVPWGGSMYVNSTTFLFIPTDKQYTYRVVKGTSDLGVRKTYERNPDGSQTINFLEYNEGFGIIDSTHIKVFATDSGNGREFLAVEWNPRNKPLGNVESQYAKEVRAGSVSWTLMPADATHDSRIALVTLKCAVANVDYEFRVYSGDNDLGARYVGRPDADKTLTINLMDYNNGEGISAQLPIKLLILDRDIRGRGTLVAARWPSDTSRDILLAPSPDPSPTDSAEDIANSASSQPASTAPSSRQHVTLPLTIASPPLQRSPPPSLSMHPSSLRKRFLCFSFTRSTTPDLEKNRGWWHRFISRF
ncbi:kinase-like protein [Pholiota conissans]|uniref:Kinase-like protein n=1 Tax=Pholiota conissans TaxID=109636 RepID=A0A9P5YP12_9AGAR|nr:kinase-like protein [Pholiota conissans]